MQIKYLGSPPDIITRFLLIGVKLEPTVPPPDDGVDASSQISYIFRDLLL